MRGRLLAATLAVSLMACESVKKGPIDPETPDAAIGTYDKQAQGGQVRSANCGNEIVVDGIIRITEDDRWVKVDIGSTPSGSSVCMYIGGTWSRLNATTVELTPDPVFSGFPPRQVAVVGDELTFETIIYKRRN